MTKEHLRSVFELYIASFGERYPAIKNEPNSRLMIERQAPIMLEHCTWMCQEAIKLIDDGRIEKAMRWLGFVQGCYYAAGIFSIDDMREHSTS